jgi:hypothetical protein
VPEQYYNLLIYIPSCGKSPLANRWIGKDGRATSDYHIS